MASDTRPFKIPQSVLVVIHTPALDVLLIDRADATQFWQSVTGSKDEEGESFEETAVREVAEETGIDCGPGAALHSGLKDWHLENVYDIYPRWQHRYAPGVSRNTEHVFGLCVPAGTPPCCSIPASTPVTAGCHGARQPTPVSPRPTPRPSCCCHNL